MRYHGPIIQAVIRHLLGALGAVLAQRGLVSSEEVDVAIGGAVAVAAVLWSVAEKWSRSPESGDAPK